MNNTFSYMIKSPCVFSVWSIWAFINNAKHRHLEFLLLIPMEKNHFLPSSCISHHSNDIMCKQPIVSIYCVCLSATSPSINLLFHPSVHVFICLSIYTFIHPKQITCTENWKAKDFSKRSRSRVGLYMQALFNTECPVGLIWKESIE